MIKDRDIVFYSMGICSTYIACRMRDEGSSPICLFSDTKREDVDTYRFGWEVAKRWDLEVHEASNGMDLWEWFRTRKMIPARQLAACSIDFKIKPAQSWLTKSVESGRVAYGYDINEQERAERTMERWPYPNLKVWFPLMEWGVEKAECFGYFMQHEVAAPRVYAHFQHANCMPCKNFKRPDWIALQYHYPDIFKEAKEFEEETGLRWMQDGPKLIELEPLKKAPSRRNRKRLAAHEPKFSFDMGCDACALD
jgi:3'-phosphoadenosine 5'-phosphosulfate sulfotransferase (PAPS reductase)/FAD synthetase